MVERWREERGGRRPREEEAEGGGGGSGCWVGPAEPEGGEGKRSRREVQRLPITAGERECTLPVP